MEINQAITIIEQALNLATQKGVFNLKDAGVVGAALNEVLKLKEPVASPPEETL